MSVVSMSVPNVVDPAALEALGTQVTAAAAKLEGTMTFARDRWASLSEVFSVFGAEGVPAMLSKPVTATADFTAAMAEAQTALVGAATDVFPYLRTRRDDLVARVTTVNGEYDAAATELVIADAAYWLAYGADHASDTTRHAGETQTTAAAALRDAEAAAGDLEADIRTFIRDLDDAEDILARSLTKISGGDDVLGAWNQPVHVSQTFWGGSSSPYPSGPSEATGLADRLRADLSTTVEARIHWFATGDPAKVEQWISDHPDFPSAVGFVDVDRAAKLWNEFEQASSRDRSSTRWDAGPLAQLFTLAPFAIGNLNGIPSAAKDEFNRQTMADLLDGDLTDNQRTKLTGISEILAKGGVGGNPPTSLQTFFLETNDGNPRASIGFGDLDDADQITTLTHGIAEDTTQAKDWAHSAIKMQQQLAWELEKRSSSDTTAVVLFMEWDSGDRSNVFGIERPDAGAERLAQTLRGFTVANPHVQLDLGLHSLGTSMGAQMIADNEGLVDNAWFFGSAGVSADASSAIERQIRSGAITIHATHATDDFVAPIGQILTSEHPEDPLGIDGVLSFGSDGGFVDGYGTGEGEYGQRVEGHNSQLSTKWYYRVEGIGFLPPGVAGPQVVPFPILSDDAVGYLDPRSQSFKQAVVDLTDAIVASDRVHQ